MIRFSFLALLALACGAPVDGEYAMPEPDAVDELGQLEQPIFMPAGYGLGTGHAACTGPLGCFVPDNKHIQLKFFASTCSSWWQTRVVVAVASAEAYVDGLGDDWALTTPGNGNYEIRCGATDGVGSFTNSSDNIEVHSSGLIQYRNGVIFVDSAEMETIAGWAGATDAQRSRYAQNIILHEIGHLIGLPHESGLMNTTADAPYGLSWTTNKFFKASQTSDLKCYNEDSGTSDDC